MEIAPGPNAEGLLYIHPTDSLEVIGTKLEVRSDGAAVDPDKWFDEIVPPPPPPKPELPIELFVPVKALPYNASKVNQFRSEVRLNYLPLKPYASLITDSVKAEVEFHFVANTVGDIDNLLKPTLDLLKGSVLYDDNQIKELGRVHFVCPSPRAGFRIRLTKHEKEG